MPQWTAFAGLTVLVLAALLILARLSQGAVERTRFDPPPREADLFAESGDSQSIERGTTGGTETPDAERTTTGESLTERGGVDPEVENTNSETDSTDAGVENAGSGKNRPVAGGSDPVAGGTDPSIRNAPRSGVGTVSDDPSPESAPSDVAVDSVEGHASSPIEEMGPVELLANVVLTQGLFAGVLIAGAWWAEIPPDALGLRGGTVAGTTAIGVGLALGLALYVANELGAGMAEAIGIDHDEALREMLAPDSAGGWAILVLLVLPAIAIFEEFLFRAALIGAFAAGFSIPPWLLAVLSSAAFAVGHGVQGSAGIVVTGLLGFVLAAAFVATGSLLVVVVAHYVINLLEFVVHEGLDVEWA